ncbi:MAG TPA: hypothetical protein ENJ00_06375 [Phycisphaerales bacterium]|nr:hypothetical protein [Phycisphaerales bacterium]
MRLLSALLALLVTSAGCAVNDGVVHEMGSSLPKPDLHRPAVAGAQEGLELRIWAIEDQDRLIAELLSAYEDRPTPMLDSERSAWRASGIRPISVPIDELNLARGRMRLIAPEERQWFGQMPGWTETVPGRRVASGDSLRLADGVLRVPAGRLRMLTRCWTIPETEGPVLQIELAVELEPFGRPETIVERAMGSDRASGTGGVLFPELSARFTMDPGEALVLVPVGPGFDAEAVLEEDDPGRDEMEVGPPIPATPTVGEAMLTSVELGGVMPVRRRALVVLLPRLPSEFRLLSLNKHRSGAAGNGVH